MATNKSSSKSTKKGFKTGAKTKGYIVNCDTNKSISFQFNPTTFQHSRGATYSEIVAPGMAYPTTQFIHGNSRAFSIELFMHDRPYTGIIAEYETFLNKLLPPEKNKSKYKKPPEILFCYGSFIRRCVVENLDTLMEEYDNNARPIQAVFTISLKQVGV